MSDYFDALVEAHDQGYDFTSIANYHADQGWDNPTQPDLPTLLAGDVVPLGSALRMGGYGGVPGFTGDVLNQLQENVQQSGGSDYYSPNQSVNSVPSNMPLGFVDNDNEEQP